jgi:hypothetical protein
MRQLELCLVNDYLYILFGYGVQDRIKYKKVYFILNIYCCQTYIF